MVVTYRSLLSISIHLLFLRVSREYFKKFYAEFFLLLGCSAGKADVELVSPKEAATLTANKKAVIIDVRSDDEWKDEHIAGAIHIPLNQLNTRLSELQQYKDSPLITQCRSGKRSVEALKLLKSAGFSKVQSMDGGILAWRKQGLATQQK